MSTETLDPRGLEAAEKTWPRPWEEYRLGECIARAIRAYLAASRPSPVPEVEAQPRKVFPVLGSGGQTIDWQLVADHGKQAEHNHGQTVKRLAERGGLSWTELFAVLHDKPFAKMDENEAILACRALEARYLAALAVPTSALTALAGERDALRRELDWKLHHWQQRALKAEAALRVEPAPEQGGFPCTCHTDDNPPRPCPQKYALSECRAAATPSQPASPQGPSEAMVEAALAAYWSNKSNAIEAMRAALSAALEQRGRS